MRSFVRRRGRLLAVLGALTLLAIGVGVGTAIGLAQTSGGSEARLRVEAPVEAVACGERFPVTVYLDELEARPSPLREGVEYGVGAVGVWLGYDPQVLRVEEGPGVVEANAELREIDPDGDGEAQLFMALGPYVDNHEGEVVFTELWVRMDPETKRGEEGPSPSWAGGPVALFTVNFLANEAGTSTLEITEVQMVDPGQEWYRPVELVHGSVEVSEEEGGCPELPLPPPLPTVPPGPTLPPTWTPEPTRTPVPPSEAVEPVPAAEGGRADCPADWYVYNDPDGRFSMCYPGGMDVSRGAAIVGERGPVLRVEGGSVGAKQGGAGWFHVFLSWGHDREMFLGPDSPYTCEDMTFTLGQTAVRPLELRLGDASAVGCAAVGRGEGLGLGPEGVGAIALYVPLPAGADVPAPGGYVNVRLYYIGPGFEGVPEEAEQMLRSIRVGMP